MHHAGADVAISASEEKPELVRSNLGRAAHEDDIAALASVLALTRLRRVAVVAERFVVERRYHELTGATLDDLRGLVLVKNDVARGVVAVVHPPWRRRGVEVKQVATLKLDHVSSSFELDLFVRFTQCFHPRPHAPDARHASCPVGLSKFAL